MKYYRITKDGYIQCIGTGTGGEPTTEEDYRALLHIIKNAPKSTDTKGYRLKTDLTWEEYEIEPDPPQEEEADANDYQQALEDLGVNFNEED